MAASIPPVLMAACTAGPSPTDELPAITRTATLAGRVILADVNGVPVFNGGYGSALAADPAGRFLYVLTDRGPNYEAGDDVKAFPVPSFTPHIGVFELQGDSLRLVRRIDLKDGTGRTLTGLPNPPGEGGNGESAVTVDGAPLKFDAAGVDPEALASIADGTFWISDEYGPHLLHVAADGTVIERINPFAKGARSLPAVLGMRRPNGGMEGLTVLSDQVTLVAIMQTPLDNPKSAGRTSRAARIIFFDTRTGTTKQYVYMLDASDLENSDIMRLTDTTFLVIERDGEFPGDPTRDRQAVKRIYHVDIAGATDVSDPRNSPEGKLFGRRTLESLGPDELAGEGIRAVSKTLFVDLVALGYPHNKPEGLAMVDANTLAVINDDDFGVIAVPGGFGPKVLPMTGNVDRNTVYYINMPAK